VIKYQNEKAAGLLSNKTEQQTKVFLQNCMRLLQPLEVVNPYANKIHLPKSAHKIRRLNELYQSFVRQITDLSTACTILFESIILKVDELDGSLRQFFERLKKYVGNKGKDYEFNRFEVRKITGVSKTQQHRYIQDLVQLEYLRQWGHANRGYKYRIAHWDDMGALRQQIKKDLERK